MQLKNGINIEIKKDYYNKMKKIDGIYQVGTDKKFPMYELNITKNYFDIEKKEDCLDKVIIDLETALHELQEIKYRKESMEL